MVWRFLREKGARGSMAKGEEQFVPETVGPTEVFYHALYHHIAHWAAYVAMMGILITIGALLSVTSIAEQKSVPHFLGTLFAISAALFGSWYFVGFGMRKYGAILNRRLPRHYLDVMLTLPHWLMTLASLIAPLMLALVDYWLVLSLWRPFICFRAG